MWELLVLIAVVAAVHWWEYSTTVQEYTFAQPADHGDLSRVLQEKTPIALEIGALPWRPEIAGKASWLVTTEAGPVRVSEWIGDRKPITDPASLAEQMELTTGLTDLDIGRPWWWLPELRDVTVDILDSQVRGLSWVSSERRWIGCSHGGPVTLWLVHSRYRRYLPSAAVNPWSLTVADAPWIGRVQYIEVTVQPGWCIGLPAHWGFAARADTESWIWTADQHSLLSFSLNLPVYKIRSLIEHALQLESL
jgi:hypothetical protein